MKKKKEHEMCEKFDKFNKNLEIQMQTKRRTTPIIMSLFDQYSDEIYNSQTFSNGTDQKQIIAKKMKLNPKQMKFLEKYDELECLILDEIVARAFSIGFSISYKMKTEVEIINNTLDI